MPKKNEQQKIAEFLAEYLLQIEDMIAEAVERILQEKYGELLMLIKEKAKPGEKGEPGEPGKSGTVVIEKRLKEKETVVFQPITKEIPAEYPSPVFTPLDIKKRLMELPIEEEWFDADHIKGLRRIIGSFTRKLKFGGSGGGGGTIEFLATTYAFDGSSVILTLSKPFTAIFLTFNGQGLRPGTDYTYSQGSSTATLLTSSGSIFEPALPTYGSFFGIGQP